MSASRYQRSKRKFLSSDTCLLPSECGFTLVEMAVVLIVIGLIILTVFPALTAVRMSSQRSLTQNNLQALMRATAAYVQANGCLPCPSPASFTGAGFGRVGTAANSAPSAPVCGACVTDPVNSLAAEGIPPFASLGLPSSTARDGWGHWITMRIDPASAANFGIVPPTKVCSCTGPMNSVCTPSSSACTCALSGTACVASPANTSLQGLCASGLNAANRVSVRIPGGNSQQAAVLFVSHGASGFGSFVSASTTNSEDTNGFRLPFSSPVSCSSTGGFAECNASGRNQFVDAPTVVGGNDPYDDVLTYADRNSLVSMLGNGSCQTAW